jgi:hypothetical protein
MLLSSIHAVLENVMNKGIKNKGDPGIRIKGAIGEAM